MVERNLEDKIFINPPYFDFYDASENYGFDFTSFEENGFSTFIKETYIHDFILFRKSYISRNYTLYRFYSHKFKGFAVTIC